MFSVLNLQESVTGVKRLKIPNAIDAFSCLKNKNITNIDWDKPRKNCYISFATHTNSFLMYSFAHGCHKLTLVNFSEYGRVSGLLVRSLSVESYDRSA